MMKSSLPIFCFFCLLSAGAAQNLPPGPPPAVVRPSVDLFDHTNSTKTDRIEVLFTRKMRFNDLVKIKLDMADQGISLDYQMLQFDAQGGLVSIAFYVDCHDSFAGSASNNSLTNQSRFGFYRDYNSVSSPFGTGAITSQ